MIGVTGVVSLHDDLARAGNRAWQSFPGWQQSVAKLIPAVLDRPTVAWAPLLLLVSAVHSRRSLQNESSLAGRRPTNSATTVAANPAAAQQPAAAKQAAAAQPTAVSRGPLAAKLASSPCRSAGLNPARPR